MVILLKGGILRSDILKGVDDRYIAMIHSVSLF